MEAKNAQIHNDEYRSGYIRWPLYFAIDLAKNIFKVSMDQGSFVNSPVIYLCGDESSHFRECGFSHVRWHVHPAYGRDIMHECMPNGWIRSYLV
ncbi:unnamed protein product, partial [Rotaria sp. Silwood1]